MSQLPLHLPHAPVFAEENFFVSESNRDAHQWVMNWPNWNSHAIILYGPAGSGKSHLGHIWAMRAQALHQPALASELSGHALIEHIETLEQETLLHMLNIAKENHFSLLLTADKAPKQLPFTLPDLTSRLLALPAIEIHACDDDALSAAMRKQFADRQLKVEEDVIAYIIPRIERSFAKVAELVEALDSASLAEGKNITIPFAKRLLG